MNFKRAILFGALFWALIFLEVSILLFGFGLPDGFAFNVWHYPLLGIIAIAVSLLYFKGRVKKGLGEGLLVGLVFAITGAILDAIITVPLFVKDYAFFVDPFILWGILEGIVITGIVGALKK